MKFFQLVASVLAATGVSAMPDPVNINKGMRKTASMSMDMGAKPHLCPPKPANARMQAAIFKDFVQKFYVARDVNGTAEHLDVNYIQHNPSVLSGRQSFVDVFSSLGNSTNTTQTIVHQALVDSIAYVHYKSETPGTPLTAVVDIFRFNGTCIMEHWDVIEALPENATNPLALF